jgi:DNA-binding MarR family transcriptional regulator
MKNTHLDVSDARCIEPQIQRANTSALDASLGYSLRRAQLSTYSEFTLFMEKYEIRPSQFAVLVLLGANPGMTQSLVADTLNIQKANLVGLLDTLQTRGLLERRKISGDRRSFALHLTRKGRSLLRKLEASHARLEAGLQKRLGKAESKRLLDLLHDFTDRVPKPENHSLK